MVTSSGKDRLDPEMRRLIGVVLLGGIMGILDSSKAAIAADTLAAGFGVSLSTVGWVSTGYLLAVSVTIPVTAWAVDRYGGRRLWLVGLSLFLVGSLAAAAAWDVGSLIAFRIVQGIGAGIVDPLMLTLLARATPPTQVGRVMGVMGVVSSTGPVLGPILGGLILAGLDWRWLFLSNAPIVILALLLALRTLPTDSPAVSPDARPSPTRLDIIGVALLGPGVASGVLALSELAQRGNVTAWQAMTPLLVAVGLLGYYLAHARHPDRVIPPIIDLRLFTRRSFTASVVAAAVLGMATFGSIFTLPLYYQQVRGYDVFDAGLLLAPFGIASALVMPFAGRLSDRLGSRALALTGATLALAASTALAAFPAETTMAAPLAASFILGLGTGCAGAPVIGSVYRTLPAALVPQGSSVLYTLNQLGAAIGIATAALIVQSSHQPHAGIRNTYLAMILALLLMTLASAFIPGRTPSQKQSKPDQSEPVSDSKSAEATDDTR